MSQQGCGKCMDCKNLKDGQEVREQLVHLIQLLKILIKEGREAEFPEHEGKNAKDILAESEKKLSFIFALPPEKVYKCTHPLHELDTPDKEYQTFSKGESTMEDVYQVIRRYTEGTKYDVDLVVQNKKIYFVIKIHRPFKRGEKKEYMGRMRTIMQIVQEIPRIQFNALIDCQKNQTMIRVLN